MLTYEKCKELKDVGYPQEDAHWYWSEATTPATLWCMNALEWQDSLNGSGKHVVACPTLSELINACGGRMEELSLFTHPPKEPEWIANAYSCPECNWNEYWLGRGSTPEDAVANLYIALKKEVTK